MRTITLGALAVLATAAGTATAATAAHIGYAEVLSVAPVYERVLTPVSQRQCWKRRMTAAPAGTRDTGSDAVARHCVTAWQPAWRQALTGYRVKYRYRGRIGTTRTDQHPGERIRVQPRLEAIHF